MFKVRLGRFVKLLACQTVWALIAQPAYGADYQVHLVDPPVTNHVVLSDDPLPPIPAPAVLSGEFNLAPRVTAYQLLVCERNEKYDRLTTTPFFSTSGLLATSRFASTVLS